MPVASRELADLSKETRTGQGLSLKKFGQLVGVPPSTLGLIETRKVSFTASHLEEIGDKIRAAKEDPVLLFDVIDEEQAAADPSQAPEPPSFHKTLASFQGKPDNAQLQKRRIAPPGAGTPGKRQCTHPGCTKYRVVGRYCLLHGREADKVTPREQKRTPGTPAASRSLAVGTHLHDSIAADIDRECAAIAELLKAKNEEYGNGALKPLRLFSKADPIEQLNVRIDDKLSRLYRGITGQEDTTLDLIGYLILRRIAQRGQKEVRGS